MAAAAEVKRGIDLCREQRPVVEVGTVHLGARRSAVARAGFLAKVQLRFKGLVRGQVGGVRLTVPFTVAVKCDVRGGPAGSPGVSGGDGLIDHGDVHPGVVPASGGSGRAVSRGALDARDHGGVYAGPHGCRICELAGCLDGVEVPVEARRDSVTARLTAGRGAARGPILTVWSVHGVGRCVLGVRAGGRARRVDAGTDALGG